MPAALLAEHLIKSELVREAVVSDPGTVGPEALKEDTAVIVCQAGPFDPFQYGAWIRAERPRIPLFLFTPWQSDYLVWKARSCGYRAILSHADLPGAWAEAFRRSPFGGFFVAPKAAPNDLERILPKLTARQVEVLELAVLGRPDDWIAGRLGISAATVESHRRDINARLEIHSWGELVMLGIRHGMVSPENVRFEPSERRNYRPHVARETTASAAIA